MWKFLDELGSEDYNPQGLCDICHRPWTEHTGTAKWPHRRGALRLIFLDGWI